MVFFRKFFLRTAFSECAKTLQTQTMYPPRNLTIINQLSPNFHENPEKRRQSVVFDEYLM